MDDFNLIDTAYRRRSLIKRCLLISAVTYVGVLLVLAGSRGALVGHIESARSEISALQSDTESILSRKRALRSLNDQKAHLQHQLKVLQGLVEGPDIDEIFYAVDRSLNDNIWFVDWKFRRAGELVKLKPEEVDTGYFIIISEGSEQQQAWKVHTHMEIDAQALNHSALAEFVRRLNSQPEVARVEIDSTHTQRVGSTEVIHFSLAVLLNTTKGPQA